MCFIIYEYRTVFLCAAFPFFIACPLPPHPLIKLLVETSVAILSDNHVVIDATQTRGKTIRNWYQKYKKRRKKSNCVNCSLLSPMKPDTC